MSRTFNVLFLCTGNTARSILAESILRHDGGGRFQAFSAGSQPKGTVNSLALKQLTTEGFPTDGLRSKSWDEFAGPNSPLIDFIFTVCDNAAGEVCPIWPGTPMTAHWGVDDPAAVTGTELEREAAIVTAFKQLRRRISVFTALPIASLDKLALQKQLSAIGQGRDRDVHTSPIDVQQGLMKAFTQGGHQQFAVAGDPAEQHDASRAGGTDRVRQAYGQPAHRPFEGGQRRSIASSCRFRDGEHADGR